MFTWDKIKTTFFSSLDKKKNHMTLSESHQQYLHGEMIPVQADIVK